LGILLLLFGVATAWSTRLLGEFVAADARARAVAQGLTPAQLNWKPRPAVWSVGQCLEHLSKANDVYLTAMALSLDGRTRHEVEEIKPGWFARYFIRNYIEPSTRTRRGRAPGKITPGENVAASILERFLGTNQQIREFVRRARHYDVNRIHFKNPFIGVIYFTVGTGLEVLSQHERRHLLQAERIREALLQHAARHRPQP
jgi:DinB family protein